MSKKQWGEVYRWSKRVHVVMMWLTIGLGGVMMVSGVVLEEVGEGEGGLLTTIFNPVVIRVIHRSLGKPFTISLLTMMVSGLAMWGVPKIMKKLAK